MFSFSWIGHLSNPKVFSTIYSLLEWRINGFIPFSKALVGNETQTAKWRLWRLTGLNFEFFFSKAVNILINIFISSTEIVIILLLREFFTPALGDGFSLEFEWHQVSWTFLSILANLSNDVVWMVSTHPLIYKSTSLSSNPLVTVPRAPITIVITVPFIFHSFFSSPPRSWYLFFFSLSFNFTLWSAGTAKTTIRHVLFIYLFFVDYL